MKLSKKPFFTDGEREELRAKAAQKIDLVKTKVWMLVAPNYFKLLKTRYDEMKEALDERDKEYEADLNELLSENDRLTKEYGDLLTHYETLRLRIDAIAKLMDL